MTNEQAVRRYFRNKMHQRRGVGRLSYVTELENLQVILAELTGDITYDELAKFFDIDPSDHTLTKLNDIRQAAIEAGKKLVR